MTRWNPWRALREREAIRFARLDLPDGVEGVHAIKGEQRAIVVDRSLPRIERNAVLAHELIHDERGHVDPVLGELEVRREERRVDREVARRLVPFDELRAFAAKVADTSSTARTRRKPIRSRHTRLAPYSRGDDGRVGRFRAGQLPSWSGEPHSSQHPRDVGQ